MIPVFFISIIMWFKEVMAWEDEFDPKVADPTCQDDKVSSKSEAKSEAEM